MPNPQVLLDTPSVTIRDVRCAGHATSGAEEHTTATHLVLPYHGVFVRRVGRDEAVAEANQLLFFNAGEGYRISHPVRGGDASLDIVVTPDLLREAAAPALSPDRRGVRFRQQRIGIDSATQVAAARLRQMLQHGRLDPLEAEVATLSLVRRAVGAWRGAMPVTAQRRRLVESIKLRLAGNVARRWTLGAIARDTGYSPVYLTQVFQQVEGVPLYRYQMRLRLARALERLPETSDITALALSLGFSSHSHFTSAFRRAYGRSPSQFRATAS
jgi:AraC family transcriptional regulator